MQTNLDIQKANHGCLRRVGAESGRMRDNKGAGNTWE